MCDHGESAPDERGLCELEEVRRELLQSQPELGKESLPRALENLLRHANQLTVLHLIELILELINEPVFDELLDKEAS
jgi:hypothetical protein